MRSEFSWCSMTCCASKTELGSGTVWRDICTRGRFLWNPEHAEICRIEPSSVF